MQRNEQFDAVVLGSGESDKYIAWHLAGTGKRTAVIERKHLGGSCPNIACLPSKNLIHSAKIATYFQRAQEFGTVSGSWRIEMAAVMDRKRRMVAGLREIHLAHFARSGAEIVMGTGRFVGERTLEVVLLDGGVRVLHGAQVFLDTGTRAVVDAIPGLAEAAPLTHVEALELDRVPEPLLVLGGGYVGLEFAQALRQLGSRVTILERSSRLVPKEDADVSDALRLTLEDEGIGILTDATAVRVEGR